MNYLPEWAPGIHPLVIHFPIALLSLAVALTVVDIFYRRTWLKNTTSGLFVLGTIGAILSYVSGRSAADDLGLNLKAEVAIGTHSDWGLYTLLYFIILTIIYLLVKFIVNIETKLMRVVLALLALIGFFILAQTAEYGGRLVFEFGLGVKNNL